MLSIRYDNKISTCWKVFLWWNIFQWLELMWTFPSVNFHGRGTNQPLHCEILMGWNSIALEWHLIYEVNQFQLKKCKMGKSSLRLLGLQYWQVQMFPSNSSSEVKYPNVYPPTNSHSHNHGSGISENYDFHPFSNFPKHASNILVPFASKASKDSAKLQLPEDVTSIQLQKSGVSMEMDLLACNIWRFWGPNHYSFCFVT